MRQDLIRIEDYYDTIPRVSADVEPIGGFALFVGPFGQSFYARPSWPASAVPTVGDVETVRARLRELGVPQAFEWYTRSGLTCSPSWSPPGSTCIGCR